MIRTREHNGGMDWKVCTFLIVWTVLWTVAILLPTQIILNGIIAGSIYALIALGFTVIYRTVKFFHFAHGVVYAAGAYLAYSFVISLGINPIISFFLAAILAGVIGVPLPEPPPRTRAAYEVINRVPASGKQGAWRLIVTEI